MFHGTVTDLKTGAPLRGIPVSDGRNAVKTDKKGRYRLPGWERCRLIFVCALTEHHSDWYVRADKKKNDFAIRLAPEAAKAVFLQMSDTEIEGRENPAWLPFVQKKVKAHRPGFVVNTGDLCRIPGVKRHLFYLNRETVGCPVRYVLGNHDFAPGPYGEALYESLYGPTWYSFDHGGVHFVVLSIGKGEKLPSGYEAADQWKWLENDLKISGAKRFVILDHTRAEDETDFIEPVGEEKIDLKKSGLIAWICGHAHTNYAHLSSGVWGVCTSRPDDGGIDSTEGGVRLVTIAKTKFSTRVLYNEPRAEKSEDFLWQTSLLGRVSHSSPLTDGKRIFAATFDDGAPKACGVFALDAKTGAILWEKRLPDGVKGALALDGKTLFCEDDRARLYALDPDSGATRWVSEDASEEINTARTGPLVKNGRVFAGAPGKVFCFDAETGGLLWKHVTAKNGNTPASFQFDEKRDRLIVSAQWRGIRALDAKTGETVWETGDRPVRFRSSTPLVTEDAIYTTGNRKLIRLDAETGAYARVEDAKANAEAAGKPLLFRGNLYVPTGNRGLLICDPETLEIRGRVPTLPGRLFTVPYLVGGQETVESSPVALGGEVVFAGSDGFLYRVSPDGAIRKKTKVGCAVTADLLVTDDAIFVADAAGRVTAFAG